MTDLNKIWIPHPGSQKQFMECPIWECLLAGNRGGGKQLPDIIELFTLDGVIKLKDVKINDQIFARDGQLYPVTGIFPQGKKIIYKMTLQDGRIIYSGDEHLWAIFDHRRKHKVLSTIEMYNSGVINGRENHKIYKYRIPNCEPVQFKEKIVPIDPYILGCLISEGALTSTTPRIATSQQHILDRIKLLYPDFEIKYDKTTTCNHTLVDRNKKGDSFPGVAKRAFKRNRLNDAIVHLGLNVTCKHKFIPKLYKYTSIKQRMELLQGLMDTDGSVGKNGHAEFDSASKKLINDVAWLCRSLGIRCRIDQDDRVGRVLKIRDSIVTQGIIYRLYINTSLPISQVPEKLKRLQNKPVSNQQKYISIVSIEKLKKKTEMMCIAIDSPDHTYLIKDFVVTHNTDVLLMDYLQDVGVGYGADYRGLILREATTELEDVIAKTKKWVPQIFPGAKFNNSKKVWVFPDGETLRLSYARTEEDYWQYHGAEYPFIGWEELTNWPFSDLYLKLMSINRSSNPDIPRKYRATCNPSGPGNCVPYGDVLTPSGWVDIKEIKLNDPIFTVDKNGKIIESIVSQIHKSYYVGEMVSIEKKGLTIECTPKHSLPKIGGIVGNRNNKFTLLEFDNLPMEAAILRSCEFSGVSPKGKFIVPTYNLKKIRKSRVIQPTECTWEQYFHLLGWFLSEGGTQKSQNSFQIAKCIKSYPIQYVEIQNLLIDIGFKFKANDRGFTVYSRDWFQYFSQFGSYEDKFIPTFCKNMNKQLLQILFNAMVDGDGTWYTGYSSGEYYTTSEKLASDVCEVALKLGYIIGTREKLNTKNRNSYTIRFKKTSQKQSNIITGNYRYCLPKNKTNKKIDAKRTKFKGNIYCIGVKDTHTFIIRQKNSVWISGNSWVKERFVDLGKAGKIHTDEYGQKRTYITSSLAENKTLLDADPTYQAKLMAMTEGNQMLRDAWILGSWDLLIGGFFTDVWDKKKQVLEPFPIPKSWRLSRSFDWGSSKPWAVTYGVETNGEQPKCSYTPYFPRGSSIIINEIYGWTGKVNEGDQATSQEIAKRVLEVDTALLTEYGLKCFIGPADTSIWEVRDGSSIANNLALHGCKWTKAYKGSGSRIAGWALIRQMLNAAKKEDLEAPGLYFFDAARHHLRTLPMLQRDKKKPEDVDTELEDHCGDSLRYLLSRKMLSMSRRKVKN